MANFVEPLSDIDTGSFSESSEAYPKTILFATIPFEYLADTAETWKSNGISGAMLGGIMRNWDSDIWELPDGERIVGDSNPLFKRIHGMNETCLKHGMDSNFIKVAFYSHLPDWFDDAGWKTLCDNFREGAIFARDSGCRGLAIDIEYIAEIYDLSWKSYLEPGYPKDRLRGQAAKRGAEIVASMLDVFPDMEILHLPEGMHFYGPLAADLFKGMLSETAHRKAPGGIHILTEMSYNATDPVWLVKFTQYLNEMIEEFSPGDEYNYWKENCSVSLGLWPLGYYRQIYDKDGKPLGWGGKKEKFGDKVIGSYADKSENYPVDDFRKQFAAAMMLSKRYIWIYCHGSVLWRLSEKEMGRYGGTESDRLPTVDNLEDYLSVIRERKVLADPTLRTWVEEINSGQRIDFLSSTGAPKEWAVIGPFDNIDGRGFDTAYLPEKTIDLSASCERSIGKKVSWERFTVPATGFVRFRRMFGRSDWLCAYAVCYVNSEGERDAVIRFGSDDGAKIWVGGEEVFSIDKVRGAEPDDDLIPVRLPPGQTPILVKVCNYEGEWGFYFRITDTEGRPLEGISFVILDSKG